LDLPALSVAVRDTKKPIPLLKQALTDFRETQEQAFASGTSASRLVQQRAAFI